MRFSLSFGVPGSGVMRVGERQAALANGYGGEHFVACNSKSSRKLRRGRASEGASSSEDG